MSEGFDQLYGDLQSQTRALPPFRAEELKSASDEVLARNESLQEIMRDPERESANGTLALINQSLIDQQINEMVSYQLQRLFRLEEFNIHGPRYTKKLVEMNGSKAQQNYFKSFSKLMNQTAVKIGHDFDLTTDMTPPTSLRCKAKIIQEISNIYLPVSGGVSFKKNEIVLLHKQDFDFLEKQFYAVQL